MKVERSLQINMAVLTVTSGLLYGMGQRDARLPVLVMIAAVASIWLTDVKGWFRVNRLAASILAVLVFLIALVQVFSFDNVTSLRRAVVSWDNFVAIRAIATMLVFLQIILLFQRKDRRIYWQLILLSLLLLVVATVFNQGALFGLLMVAYLYMALSSMALLFLYHEGRQFALAEAPLPARTDGPAARSWPLGAEASFAAGDVAKPGDEQGRAGRDFLRRLVGMGVGTLVVTAVAFFILPRFGQSAWRSPFHRQRHMVGYSDKVELGELGRVIEDPAEVLRIEFTEPGMGTQYPVDGAVYLHGTVLTRYEGRRWSLPGTAMVGLRLGTAREQPPGEIVVQRVTMEPLDRPEVFCVQPFFTLKRQPNLSFDPARGSLFRPIVQCTERFRFSLRTSAFDHGHQKSLVPALRKPADVEPFLQLPPDVPALVALARSWTDEPGWARWGRIDRARHLESKLRNSREFSYSLKTQRQDFTIDPIEDFVKNNPKGHCEYFATALALALRSQGIPSRMVVGYKCDEFNPLGGFFQVRQLHAHTWVEVYVPADEVPRHERTAAGDKPIWSKGAWLRLDPTPGSDAEQLGTAGRLFATAGKGVDWFQYLWNNYVMEMDRPRQRRGVYRPLVDWAEGTYDRLTSLQWWKETALEFLVLVDPRNWKLDEWFSWRGGLVGMGICLALVLVYRVVRRVARRVRDWVRRRRRQTAEAARTRVDFYQRLQTLLRRRGIRRLDGQTQREFAWAAGQRIAAERGRDALAGLPEQIAEAFYQVRFGDRPLDKTHRQGVEQAVARLEEALDRRHRARRRGKETATS